MLSFTPFFSGLAAASTFTSTGPFTVFSIDPTISSGCPASGTLSCHNTSTVSNLCCFESPGGLLLQTQFWDTNPSTGPNNSWTIHGLWPDNCDGTFEENCDPSRDYTGISSLLTSQGASSTLSFMQTFWKNINGDDEELWEHEWATHGTCMSTLHTSCLPSGSPKGAEAVAFFETVVRLFQTLPTFTWLANQGITPSNTATHTLASLTSALKTESGGFAPSLDCDGSTLDSISWFFNLEGSVIDGTFVPISAPSSEAGSCPSSGIKYPPKTGSPVSTSTSTSTGSSPTGGGGLPSKATMHAIQNGSQLGGLLSAGTWSTQTLATYTLSGTSSSFTMTSSKGSCGVSDGKLSCGSSASSTSFSAVQSGSNLLLASGDSTTFSSTGVPSGETVETVFADANQQESYTLVIVAS